MRGPLAVSEWSAVCCTNAQPDRLADLVLTSLPFKNHIASSLGYAVDGYYGESHIS